MRAASRGLTTACFFIPEKSTALTSTSKFISPTSSVIVTGVTYFTSYYQVRSVNLQNTFRFWPVSVVGLVDGWAYGTYAEAKSLGYRELIERGRLHRVRRNKGVITE